MAVEISPDRPLAPAGMRHKAKPARPEVKLEVSLKTAYMRGESFHENIWREQIGLPVVANPDVFPTDETRQFQFNNTLGEQRDPPHHEIEAFLARLRGEPVPETPPQNLSPADRERARDRDTINALERRLAVLEGREAPEPDLAKIPTSDWGVRDLRKFAKEYGLLPIPPRTSASEAFQAIVMQGLERELFTEAELNAAGTANDAEDGDE